MASKTISTTRNIISIAGEYEKLFLAEFSVYLDALDAVFELQSNAGLTPEQMGTLSQDDQEKVRTYIVLAQQANTVATAVLRLLSSNIVGVAYLMLRLLYQTAALMHYGNKSAAAAARIRNTFIRSALKNGNQTRQEKRLRQMAQNAYEQAHQGMSTARRLLDEYSGDLSRAQIVAGVDAHGNEAAPASLVSKFHSSKFLLALDLLYNLTSYITQQLLVMMAAHGQEADELSQRLRSYDHTFMKHVRPRLQAKAVKS